MKSISRVSGFQPGPFPQHLHSSFPHMRRSGPPSLAYALQGALAMHPVPRSFWSLSKKEKMVSTGSLFFTLAGFLLPLSWNRYLQSKCS